MTHRTLSIAALAAALIGCSKSGPDPSGRAGDQQQPPEVADPNATHTVTIRGPHKGDVVRVVKNRKGAMSATSMNATQTQYDTLRLDYIETILDAEPGEPPVKLSREYKVAQRSDPKGEMMNLPFMGRTVAAERIVSRFKYTIDGKLVSPAEQREFDSEFTGGRGNFEGMLPSAPVKVGQSWAVDLAAVKALAGNAPFESHKEKSRASGKLVRAYKKDGQQCGVVEWKIDLVIDTHATNGSPITGSLPSTVTYDGVIDGSSRAGTMKMTLKGSIDHRDVIGHEVKTTIEGTQEQTVTPVK
jgi:hypothetical protein